MTSSSASCIPLISTSSASRMALKSIRYSRDMVSPPRVEYHNRVAKIVEGG